GGGTAAAAGCLEGGAGEGRGADAGVVGKEERRLPARVPRPDDVDIEAVRVRSFTARGAVEQALADEAVESLDRELSPRDAARENDRLRAQDVAAVQIDEPLRRGDAGDRAGDGGLGGKAA